MPVIAAPPRAAETALAPWPASPEEEAVLIVPAQQELLPLQPSKLAVYKLFIEQVSQLTISWRMSTVMNVQKRMCITYKSYVGCLLCY